MSGGTGFREFQRAVAGRLVSARKDVSQNRLAQELGYSQQMISRYESGRVPKCFLFLARLAERRQVDVNWILAGLGRASEAEGAELAPRFADAGAGANGASAGAGGSGRAAGLLAEDLAPELYEDYEPEAVLTLLTLWSRATGELRERLADRLRSVILWWRARQPALSGPLAALAEALEPPAGAPAGGESNPSVPLEVLGEIADAFRRDEGPESQRLAVRFYRFLLRGHETAGDEAGRALALIRLGQLQRKAGQWARARELYTSGLRVAESLADASLLEEGWAGLGNLAKDLGDLAAARSFFRKELEAALRTGDPKLRIRCYVSLSLVAGESGQHVEEGLEYADRGLELCDLREDEEYRSELLINRGLLLAALGRRAEARAAYDEAVKRAPVDKEVRLKAIAYQNCAELALSQGDAEKAIRLLARAETWCGRGDQPRVRCSILVNRGRAHLAAGRLREAARAAREAMEMAQERGLETAVREARALSLEIEEGIPARVRIA